MTRTAWTPAQDAILRTMAGQAVANEMGTWGGSVKPEKIEAVYANLLSIGEECVRAINTQPGAPYIVIRGHFPVKGWPRGKCCGSDSQGRFYWYDARKVLAKIIGLGIMTVEFSPSSPQSSEPPHSQPVEQPPAG